MQTFAIILVLGFSYQVSHAFWPGDKEKCVIENGFTNSENDLTLVDAIGDPAEADRLNKASKEKLADVLACLFPKSYKKTSLYDYLKFLTDADDKITKDQHQEMIDTLSSCKTKENNAELLKCVNAFQPPFDYLIKTLHELGEEALLPCYGRCEMKIPDFYTLETYEKKIDELLTRLGANKLYCLTACKVDREDDPKQIIFNILEAAIDLKTEYPSDKKKEMKDTLGKCLDEAREKAKKENEGDTKGDKLESTMGLLRCVKTFELPFLDLLRH